jgi:VCBS repeat-containing protein
VIGGETTGSVTEKGGINNGTPGVATATGTLSATDVDSPATFVAQNNAAEGHGTFSISSAGAWSYTLDDSNASVQALGIGGILHDLVTVATADGTTQQIDITVHGADDTPVMVTQDLAGAVTEQGTPAGNLTDSGVITFSDVDLADVHLVSPTGTPVGATLGALTAVKNSDTTGSGTGGQLTWTYTVPDAAVEYLAAGQTKVESFTISLDDQHGGVVTRQIDVTVAGTNDAPVIGAADLTGAVTDPGTGGSGSGASSTALNGILTVDNSFELYLSTDDSVLGTLLATGNNWPVPVTLSPASLTSGVTNYLHVVAHNAGGPGGFLGDFHLSNAGFTFANGAVDDHTNAVDWKLSLSGFGANYVTPVDEGANGVGPWGSFGGISGLSRWLWDHASQATNDLNTEYFSLAINPGSASFTDSGTIGFSDVDLTDVHLVSPTGVPIGSTLGSLTVVKNSDTTGTGTGGLLTWTYNVAPSALAALGAGQTKVDSFQISIDDQHGGLITRQVDVTLSGRNDAAVIGGTTSGSVTEKGGVANGTPGVATATGILTVTDVDSPATFVAENNASETYGTFSISAAGAWSYTLDDNNASVQALNIGDTLHDLVTVATADGTTRQIDITIHGADDAVQIGGTLTGLVTEAGGLSNQTPGVATATGTLTATDVDSPAAFVAQAGATTTYGSFSIDASGAWSYTLNDSNASVEALNDGDTLHDLVTVATAVGVTQQIDITIGGADDLGTDLAVLDPSRGLFVQGANAGDHAGFSVSAAGDVNGDGFDDFIVGAPYGADGLGDAGAAYVVFGTGAGLGTLDGSGRTVIDLATLDPANGFLIRGDANAGHAGWSVSSAGDVNGDGFDDVIVGAPFGGLGGNYAGQAYVVFGKASGLGAVDDSGRAAVDLTDLPAADGFVIRGATDGDAVGWSVSAAGDVNGDGFADVIVGAPLGSDTGSFAGQAYVVFGKASGIGTVDASGHAVIDLASLSPASGLAIKGAGESERVGWSVASAGDVNGDGFDDLVVGAPLGGEGGLYAGQAYVVFGKASGLGTVDGSGHAVLNVGSNFSPSQGFVIQGDASWSFAGWSVSSAGDVNGDGFADVIVGEPFGADGTNNAGQAYVVYGSASGFGTLDSAGRALVDLANHGSSFTADKGFVVYGDAARDQVGFSVSAAGDVNGDGIDDLIVGAPFESNGGESAGEAYVIFGQPAGLGMTDITGRAVVDLANFAPLSLLLIQGDGAGSKAGVSVAAAGDVNGDGFADLLVGAPNAGDGGPQAGGAYVLFGGLHSFGDGSGDVFVGSQASDAFLGNTGPDVFYGLSGNDTFVAGTATSSPHQLWGGDGSDTADYSQQSDPVYVDLRSQMGFVDRGHGLVLTDQMNSIENVTGGSGNDTLIGDDGANRLAGGGGSDALYGLGGDDTFVGGSATSGQDQDWGGDGSDTVDYSGQGGAVHVDLRAQAGWVDRGSGFVLTDQMNSIENAIGGSGGDTLVGDGGANRLDGQGGSDLLYGLGGDDVLMGGAAAAGSFNQLWGGDGSDTASYAFAATAVYADLNVQAGWVSGGNGTLVLNDTYNSIENLSGGAAADVLIGDGNSNVLQGGAGADVLYGGGGADRFVYASASDSSLTTGYDTIADFQTGVDTLDLSALHIDASQVLIQSAGNSTVVYADTNPATQAYDLAISVIGANAVAATDLRFA